MYINWGQKGDFIWNVCALNYMFPLTTEKRRPELIPEDLLRQYVHTVQDKVYPEVQKLLEDFR